jgi:uncharacterized protein
MMPGWFLLVWFAASAGMAKWLSMASNRLHAFGWRRVHLKWANAVHSLLLVGYPLLCGWSLGLAGPRLLWNQDWSRLSVAGGLALGIGLAGTLCLIVTTIEHWRYRPPAAQTDERSRLVDMSAEREQFLGTGRGGHLARLPYNEQFSLEVHERTYALPRLPAGWDGATLVHLSDVHFRGVVNERYFQRVMEEVARLDPEGILFTGDLLDRRDCLSWIPRTFGRLSAPLGCLFILGNHDWYVGCEPQIRETLTACGWTDVGSRTLDLTRGGDAITICGNERPWLGRLPELADVPAERFRLAMCHSPDQIDWARTVGIDLLLAGHTHGGQIRLPLLGPIYAPSLYGCRYSAGVFQVGETLMSVTRGISGREPIRYGCRPEIVKLTLRRATPKRPTS